MKVPATPSSHNNCTTLGATGLMFKEKKGERRGKESYLKAFYKPLDLFYYSKRVAYLISLRKKYRSVFSIF